MAIFLYLEKQSKKSKKFTKSDVNPPKIFLPKWIKSAGCLPSEVILLSLAKVEEFR